MGASAAVTGASATMHMQQAPMQQMPMQQMPMQQMPMQQMPMQQAPMQQMPMQQAPMQQAPMQQMPMQQMVQMMMGRMGTMPQQPALAQPSRGMPGATPSVVLDRLDGRIAFLHAELRITQTQMQAWDEFAAALRTNSQRLTELHATLVRVPPPAEGSAILSTLEQGESVLAARLDGLRAIRASYGRLLAVLDDAQRRTAEELIWPHLGLS